MGSQRPAQNHKLKSRLSHEMTDTQLQKIMEPGRGAFFFFSYFLKELSLKYRQKGGKIREKFESSEIPAAPT